MTRAARSRRRVLIVGDRRKGRVAALARQLEPALAKRVSVVDVDLDHKLDLASARADLIVVLGGDGSILQTARRLGGRRLPLMGVNLGNLGFLATVSAEVPAEQIAEHAAGDLVIEERGRLRVETGRFAADALNDAVVDRGSASRLLTLGVRIDGQPAFDTRGDGLVIATPTGSTAYSLAAGGPVLHPGLAATLVTPLCPHSLTNRPIVMPADAPIEVTVLDAGGAARLSVDGRVHDRQGLAVGARVLVRRSKETLWLAVLRSDDFYARLRKKLHFARPAEG